MQKNIAFEKKMSRNTKTTATASSTASTSDALLLSNFEGSSDFERTAQAPRDMYKTNNDVTCATSLHEVSLIETVTSFLEENGAAEIDPKILRNLAEALSKRVDDTSPGTVHDVTMDNTYFGYRSAATHGNSSPMVQGRSIRDFEEQMSSLRKENFNLKLRIYFMEEKLPGYKNGMTENVESKETLLKQVIDSKVEIEILRKEIQEKQDLLKEAAQAITQMENMQKDTEAKSQELLEEMQERLQYYEEHAKFGDGLATPTSTTETPEETDRKIRELEQSLAEIQAENKKLDEEVNELQNMVKDRDSAIRSCEEKIKELAIQNSELLDNGALKSEDCRKLQSTINSKIATNKDLRERLIEYDSVMKRQTAELDVIRRENKFYRDIMDQLQRKRELHQLKLYENSKSNLGGNGCGCGNGNCSGSGTGTGSGSKTTFKPFESDHLMHSSSYLPCTQCVVPDVLLHASNLKNNLLDTTAKHENFKNYSLRESNSATSLHTNFSSMSIIAETLKPPKRHNQKNHSTQLNESDVIQELKTELANKICEFEEAQEKLLQREKIHDQACRTIQKLMQNVNNQQKEINKLKLLQEQQQNDKLPTEFIGKEKPSSSQTSGGAANECTGLCRSLSDSEALHELSLSQKQRYELQMAEQQETIKQLRAEVKKKTANLQNLVNRELWEKNREIERLTKLVAGGNSPLSPNNSANAVNELQQSFSDVEYTKALERNKLLQRKVDILIQRLGADRQQEKLVTELREELRQAKADTESAEKWRRDCADVCSVLTNRLEELAGFLNSLLKHKDVLGVLAADRRRAMRRAVDRSLDLSKSLNMTLSISGISLADQSLAQLSNLSEILGEVEALDVNRTFNSHEELHAQTSTIESLKAENKALKTELQKRRTTDGRKERRSLPLTMQQQQQLDNQSESEAWSEPDRKVSLARIGLEDHSASLGKEMPNAQAQCTDSDSEAQSPGRQTIKLERSRNSERIMQLEQLIAQRDERILSIQCQLVEADNRLKQENLRVLELEQDLADMRLRNDALHADLVAIGTQDDEPQMSVSVLQQEIADKTQALEQLKAEHDRLKADAQVSEMELFDMRNEIDALNVKHEVAMALAAEHERDALHQLKLDMEALLQQRLDEQMQKHQEALARDFVAANSYEEIKQQLLELQRQYVESLRNLEYHQENEKDLKQSLIETEVATRALKKQLDESTLQASKAVMERTKAYNEKLQLEQQVEALNQQLSRLHSEQQQQLKKLQQQQQQQQQKQKQKQQEQRQTQRLNSSDVSQSGYTSEEVPQAVNAQRATVVGAQRMNNSSPDLGIESDAGRVSSVELSNAQHALLKTVELEGAVNAIKKEQIGAAAGTSGSAVIAAAATTSTEQSSSSSYSLLNSKHDCAKVDQENSELKRKLVRTKRALEDTYEKLRMANKAKAQVEKDIKNQILKTHNVLRNVRSNMENEM